MFTESGKTYARDNGIYLWNPTLEQFEPCVDLPEKKFGCLRIKKEGQTLYAFLKGVDSSADFSGGVEECTVTIQGETRNLGDVSQDLIDYLIQEMDKWIPKSYSFFTEFMVSDIGLTMSEVVKWRPTQNRDVFEALLAANQFICSNIPRFLCMANDPEYSSTVEYREFADKYACPNLMRHISRFVDQITGHQLKAARRRPTLKFDRF